MQQVEVLPGTNELGERIDAPLVVSRLEVQEGEPFSQNDFDRDLKALGVEFDRVEPQFEVDGESLYITLKLWPKPTVRNIRWVGNTEYKDKTLRKELSIEEGSVFDRRAFMEAFRGVKAFYVKKGYFEAELSYELFPVNHGSEMDIEVTVREGRSGRIEKLEFEGLSRQEETDLANLMVTKTYSLLTSWMTEKGTYNEEMILHDRLNIQNYLQNHGYADASVQMSVEDSTSSNRIIIKITVDKGELYHFGSLTFAGHTLFSDEQIARLFSIHKGDPYSPEAIRETVDAISNLYGRKGYIDALVMYEPHLHPDRPEYSVHFEIEEGESYRVGLIRVLGNCRTHTPVILHETLLVPGETFDREKLRATERRLRNIGYFESVNVYAMRAQGESHPLGDNFRDVIIEVEEAQTGSFSFSFGFSTAESVFGGFNLTERNFNLFGLPCIFKEGYRAMRGGGEYAHFRIQVGEKNSTYLLSWSKPYWLDSCWTFGFDLEKATNRVQAEDYDIRSISETVYAKYTVNQFLRFNLQYRIKYTDIKVPTSATPLMQAEADNSGLTSAVSVAMHYDSTNHPSCPTDGFRSKLMLEYAGLGGDHDFVSVSYLNTSYTPLHNCGILKLRGDVRFIFPLFDSSATSLPLEERLFLGGDNTIRGYRPYAIGPKFDNGDPRGGVSQTLLSAEYCYRFSDSTDAFLFADAGQISLDTFAVTEPKVSVGGGVRLKVLPGGPPVTVGYGVPLNSSSRSERKKFFFMLGGKF